MDLNHEPSTLRSGHHDVIVVGARVAGASTALLLARAGLRTLLIDQTPLGADTLSTHALMRGGVMQLRRWGVLDTIIAAGTPPVRRTTFRYGAEEINITVKSSHGVDALYAPRRTVLDPALVRAAIAAGAEFHHRTSVTDVVKHGDRVIGIRANTSDGRIVELSAPLIIGADGIRSTVARQVGAPITRAGSFGSRVAYGYWSELDADGYEWVFRPNASSGVIPTNDGQACVFASASIETLGRGGVDVITELVERGSGELAERLRRAVAPRGTRTWASQPGFMRRPHGPGWALVGDAGYFKDPLSAHGLTDALRDAELLARSVIAGLNSDVAMADALAEYEATRDRLSTPLFDIVDRIASQTWDDSEIGDLLVQLSSSMVDEVEAIASFETEPGFATELAS